MVNEAVGPGSPGHAGTIIEVAIGPGSAPGRFKVEVIRSPAGESSVEIEFDPTALLGRRSELQNALLASAVQARRYLPEAERAIREVGEVLYTTLLGAGEIAGRYQSAATVAQIHEHGLRLSLRIDTPELAGLPWEAMYDRSTDSYICLQDQLVRRVNVPSVPAPLTVQPPLRILAIVSAPRGLPALDVEKERGLLTQALARPVADGLVTLTWASTATWADLQDLLLSEQWHVLHFIGHGDFDPVQDEGVLVLTDEFGRPDPVEAHRFTDLLREARPRPRLVVLNSCSGAAVGVTDLFSGTAAALVRGGVSAVAAMQYEVSDAAGAAFSRGFYSAIAHGRGVDDAVSSGRRAIRGTSSRTLEWLTPVLYLRGDSTQLFNVPAGAGRAQAEVEVPKLEPEPAPLLRGGLLVPRRAQGDHDDQLHEPTTVRRPRPEAGPSRLARVMTGHSNWVACVAFSPDGELLATGSRDRTARLWDPATGRLVRGLTGHTDIVYGVAFSPDGTLLATCGGDRTTRVWATSTAAAVRTLKRHTDIVRGVAVSPDGTKLATASFDRTARLWNASTGKAIRVLGGHDKGLTAIAFSPVGDIVATASTDETVQLWRVATETSLHTLGGHAKGARGVAFNRDGSAIATTSGGGTVYLWDPASGKLIRSFTGHTDAAIGVAFSPDGALLATTGSDQTVRIWDVASGESIRTLTGHEDAVISAAFSPDGRYLATASFDKTARIWE